MALYEYVYYYFVKPSVAYDPEGWQKLDRLLLFIIVAHSFLSTSWHSSWTSRRPVVIMPCRETTRPIVANAKWTLYLGVRCLLCLRKQLMTDWTTGLRVYETGPPRVEWIGLGIYPLGHWRIHAAIAPPLPRKRAGKIFFERKWK